MTQDHSTAKNSDFTPDGTDNPSDAPDATSDVTDDESASDTDSEQQVLKDKWMRAEAELQNFRARSKRDIDDARQYAIQKFARDVVEAAENLQRGLASLPPRADNDSDLLTKLREGLEGTERAFLSILERNGISCEHPKGKAFDANLHQAMAETETLEHAPGTIVESWTPTWTLHGRLLKPAMVVVAKRASNESESA